MGLIFLNLLEKAKYFCGKNVSVEEISHEFQRLPSASLGLQIPPNLEFILGN